MLASSIFFINDTCIVGTSRSKRGQFYVYNPVQDSINHYDFYPQKSYGNEEGISKLFVGVARIRPDLNKIAYAYLYFNRIDVFDISTKEIVTIRVPVEGESKMSNDLKLEELKSNEYGYFDLFLTNKHIYALKNNCSRQSKKNGNFMSEIHIFLWNGDPVGKYILSDPIENFVVMEKRRKIYGGHYYTSGILSEFSY